jgi:hypothetical protein
VGGDVTAEVSLPRQGIPGAFSTNGHRDPACTAGLTQADPACLTRRPEPPA